MTLVEHHLYTCTYAATYYVTVSAIDQEQARFLFGLFLRDRGIEKPTKRLTVKRQSHPRPVYSYA